MVTELVRPKDPALTKIAESALDGTYDAYEHMRAGLRQELGMKPGETKPPSRFGTALFELRIS